MSMTCRLLESSPTYFALAVTIMFLFSIPSLCSAQGDPYAEESKAAGSGYPGGAGGEEGYGEGGLGGFATPPKIRLSAQLLLLKADWSKGKSSKEIESDVRRVLADAKLPEGLMQPLPATAGALLFPEGLATIYRNEDLDALIAWLDQHDLVNRRQVAKEQPLGPADIYGIKPLALTVSTKDVPYSKLLPDPGLPLRETRYSWQCGIGVPSELGGYGMMGYGGMPGMSGGYGLEGGYPGEAVNESGVTLHISPKLQQEEVITYPVESVLETRNLFSVWSTIPLKVGEAVVLSWYTQMPEWERQSARSMGVDPMLVVRVLAGDTDPAAAEDKTPVPSELRRPLRVVMPASERRTTGRGRTSPVASPASADSTPSAADVNAIPLRFVKAEDAVRFARELFADDAANVRIAADPATNMIVIRGTKSEVEELKALIEKLDAAPTDSMYGSTPRPTVVDESPSEEALRVAREQYASAEQATYDIAARVRAMQGLPERHPQRVAAVEELRTAVDKAFQRRLELQWLEAAAMRRRLAKIEVNLAQREKLQNEITARRVEQLLEDPALRWDAKQAGSEDNN